MTLYLEIKEKQQWIMDGEVATVPSFSLIVARIRNKNI